MQLYYFFNVYMLCSSNLFIHNDKLDLKVFDYGNR